MNQAKKASPRTYLDKVWDEHVIMSLGDEIDLVHIDRHFLHEMSGAVSLRALAERRLNIANPELTCGTVDHVLETYPGRTMVTKAPGGTDCLTEYHKRILASGIRYFRVGDPRQGIVHVIAPDLGIALPGATFVCGDSHTCTVGGIGALAFGVGTSDSEHVLATQTLTMTKPPCMKVTFEGILPPTTSAKDMILALIGRFGANGGKGYAIEFGGRAVESLSIPARLTLCNMAVEFGARTGFVVPDQVTFDFLEGRPFAPKERGWHIAVRHWQSLKGDADASYDAEIALDCTGLAPQITWGTSPEHVMPIDAVIPAAEGHAERVRALDYMHLVPGEPLVGKPINAVFLGSCTNSRLEDLQDAAKLLKGRRVAPHITAICSPGSTETKMRAEAEGLDSVFIEAGFQWRESGCSLCISGGMGGEAFRNGARVLASTNRNFEHRQGRNVRSHLASPITLAASAIAGAISDPRMGDN